MLYRVYYQNEPSFEIPKQIIVGETHTFVRKVEALSPEDVYREMQAEIWSPNGEARDLIRKLGLRHTSMSVGDVIRSEDGFEVYVVDDVGFRQDVTFWTRTPAYEPIIAAS